MNSDKKNKGIAVLVTLLFHALVVLLLFSFAFRTPLPLPGEEGVEVDLGMYNQGMGLVQPDKPQATAPKPVEQEPVKAKEELATQDDNEAPALEKPKKEEKKVEQQPEEKQQPKANPKALFKGSSTNAEGGSEGITGQPGDQGNPNGLSGVKRYDGQGGQGNGPGYSLGNRGALSLMRPDKDFPEEGIVVVDIWVNKTGHVVRAEVASKGTTIINTEMKNKALKAARQSLFTASNDAPEEQKGTITYTFIFNQ